MSRIHGHFGGCGARPSVASGYLNDKNGDDDEDEENRIEIIIEFYGRIDQNLRFALRLMTSRVFFFSPTARIQPQPRVKSTQFRDVEPRLGASDHSRLDG